MFSLQCRGIFSFFWKEVRLTHPFIIQLSTQQTSKHPFIHSSPSFKNCLLSFHIGYKCYLCHWARLRMVIDRQGTCSLCVSSRGAGNVKIVPPAPKELKSHSFFLLVIRKCLLRIYVSFSFCPLMAIIAWVTEHRGCPENKEQAGGTCTFSRTHLVPHRGHFTSAPSVGSSGRLNWVAQHGAEDKGKKSGKSVLYLPSFLHRIYCIAWDTTWLFFIY